MAARRLAASAVDWAAFTERVHPGQIEAFRAFKAMSDAFITKYVICPMSPGSLVFVNGLPKSEIHEIQSLSRNPLSN